MSDDNIRVCEYRRYGTTGEWRPVHRDTKIAELLQRAERAESRVKYLEAFRAWSISELKKWRTPVGHVYNSNEDVMNAFEEDTK